MSELFVFIDLYCERTAVGFLNEPLNAFSNASFILAGLWALFFFRREQVSLVFWLLCGLGAVIGVGSFAFHTVPSVFTQWLDVIPIWAFVFTYAMAITHSVVGKRWLYTLSVCAVVLISVIILFKVAGNSVSATPPGGEARPLNGSLQYLPVVLVLLSFSMIATLMNHGIKRHLWLATGLFAVALIFRTIDIAVCTTFPIGTHFIWHLLDGALIAVLLHGLIRGFQDSGLKSVNNT